MENEQYEQYFKPYEERIQNLKVLEAEKTKEINDLRKSINDMIKIISEYKKSTIVTNVPSKTGQNDRPQTSLLPKREEKKNEKVPVKKGSSSNIKPEPKNNVEKNGQAKKAEPIKKDDKKITKKKDENKEEHKEIPKKEDIVEKKEEIVEKKEEILEKKEEIVEKKEEINQKQEKMEESVNKEETL